MIDIIPSIAGAKAIRDSICRAVVRGRATQEDALVFFALKEPYHLILNIFNGWDGDLEAAVKVFGQGMVRRLLLFGDQGLNIESVKNFRFLEDLHMAGLIKGQLDLDWFPELRHFGINFVTKGRGNVVHLSWGGCEKLEEIRANGVNLPSIAEMAKFPSLKTLDITRPMGMPEDYCQIKKLECLKFAYWTKLASISQFGSLLGNLEQLSLYSTSKLFDYTAVSKMHSIKTIHMENCPPISSLSLFSELHQLENLWLVAMKIIDADTSAVYRMPNLRSLAIMDQKHLRPSREALEMFLEQRNADIPG